MTLVRWQPLRKRHSVSPAHYFNRNMHNLFNDFFNSDEEFESSWSPRVDVVELEDKFEFSAELPGISKDNVKLELNENILTISGEKSQDNEGSDRNIHFTERFFGSFHRSFRIPAPVDSGKIEAAFENGILRITLPKSEESKPKLIDIKMH